MRHFTIKQVPNVLTTLRLILALPICLLILDENYPAVLWLAFIAGGSDAIDGYLARRLNALSHYGAVLDPLADKTLLLSVYISLTVVGVVPWWLAAILVVRDMLIVSGAFAYRRLFGRYQIAPSIWGKISTGVQIVFALMILTQQVFPVFTVFTLQVGLNLLIFMAFVSGSHYMYVWGEKILAARQGNGRS